MASALAARCAGSYVGRRAVTTAHTAATAVAAAWQPRAIEQPPATADDARDGSDQARWTATTNTQRRAAAPAPMLRPPGAGDPSADAPAPSASSAADVAPLARLAMSNATIMSDA